MNFLPKFSPAAVWQQLMVSHSHTPSVQGWCMCLHVSHCGLWMAGCTWISELLLLPLHPPKSGLTHCVDCSCKHTWTDRCCQCPDCSSHVHVQSGDVSVLMAVPTMYSYLLSHYDQHMSEQEQAAARQAAAGLRLTVSGSAAAPVPLLRRWQELSGQMLLERYGMTETGMILSNPYKVNGLRRTLYMGDSLITQERWGKVPTVCGYAKGQKGGALSKDCW